MTGRAVSRALEQFHLRHARDVALSDTTRRNGAFLAGERARLNGRALADNPFPRTPDPLGLRARWRDGYGTAAGWLAGGLEDPPPRPVLLARARRAATFVHYADPERADPERADPERADEGPG